MKLDKKIIDFVKKQTNVSIPELQVKFGMSYHAASVAINELVDAGIIKYDSDITYKVCAEESEKQSDRSESFFDYMRRRNIRNNPLFDEDEDDDDDKDDSDKGEDDDVDLDLDKYELDDLCCDDKDDLDDDEIKDDDGADDSDDDEKNGEGNDSKSNSVENGDKSEVSDEELDIGNLNVDILGLTSKNDGLSDASDTSDTESSDTDTSSSSGSISFYKKRNRGHSALAERFFNNNVEIQERKDRLMSKTAQENKIKALKYVVDNGRVSPSLIQYSLGVSRQVAYELTSWMDRHGYTTPSTPFNYGRVLISEKEYAKIALDYCFKPYSEKNSSVEGKNDKNLDGSAKKNEDTTNGTEGVKELSLSEIYKKYNYETQTISSFLWDKKCENPSTTVLPKHPSWNYDDYFEKTLAEYARFIMKHNQNLSVTGAANKARCLYEAACFLHNDKLKEIFERLYYEFSNMSRSIYTRLRKKFFDW